MTDKADGARRPSSAKARPPGDATRQRSDFAAAIAKAEFGRFYWSGAQERALQEAKQKRRKPAQ